MHRPNARSHIHEAQAEMMGLNLFKIEPHAGVMDGERNLLAVTGQF
jgi:hypothetical protein